MMIESLIRRIVDARAVNRLSALLAEIKENKELKRNDLRTSGTVEEICESARNAIEKKLFTAEELADLVDELEENGYQHIFLFELVRPKRAKTFINELSDKFKPIPSEPTPAFYSNLPSSNRVFYDSRGDTSVVKMVGKTSYWVLDKNESHEDANRQVIVRTRRESRVVHLLRIHVDTGLVEIRIQHASNEASTKQWQIDLDVFLARFDNVIAMDDLEPVPIWLGFREQVKNRDETFMTVDEAHDAVTRQRISLRRERGQDLRENDDYILDNKKFGRDTLRIYWNIPDGRGKNIRVHTIQQKVDIGGVDHCKIWVPRHVSSQVLSDVLDKIQKLAA